MDFELRWSTDCLSADNLPLPTSPYDREPLGYTIKTHWLPKQPCPAHAPVNLQALIASTLLENNSRAMQGPVQDKSRTAMGATVTLHYKRVEGPATGSEHTGPIIYIPRLLPDFP
ncbi:unnamed protein product [Leuciscus chuanchicus]